MRHRAGAAPPRSRYIGAASLFLLGSSLFLLGIFVLGFAASRAVAGGPLAPDVGTQTTPAATTAAQTTTTAPAPDPKPPVPNPDPKPGRVQKRVRVTPPPPPPPPPPAPAAQRNASRRPATRKPVVPTRRAQAVRRARKAAAQEEAAAALAVRRAQRLRAARAAKEAKQAARAKVAHPKAVARAKPVVHRKRTTRKERRRVDRVQAATVLGPAPTPVLGPRLTPSSDAGTGALPLIAPILGLGLLALGASAVSPRRVPWPAVAQPLHVHRTDLAVAGVGLIGLALLALNVIVVL
jgi:hypothetical protein